MELAMVRTEWLKLTISLCMLRRMLRNCAVAAADGTDAAGAAAAFITAAAKEALNRGGLELGAAELGKRLHN